MWYPTDPVGAVARSLLSEGNPTLGTHTGESPTNTVALHQDVSWQAFLTVEPRSSWLADTLSGCTVTVTVDRASGVAITLLAAATCHPRAAVIACRAPTEEATRDRTVFQPGTHTSSAQGHHLFLSNELQSAHSLQETLLWDSNVVPRLYKHTDVE